MSEYYDKCQFYAGSCHYSSPNHYDPNYVCPGQYRPDQYYPDCYPYYPEPTLVPSRNGTPPFEEDSHHSDVQSDSGDEIIGDEPEQQAVSKSKPPRQRLKSLSRLPQVINNKSKMGVAE